MGKGACMAKDALSDAFFEARKLDVQERVNPRRFEHILGVAATAKELARAYGVDERKARLGGLLHDWDKDLDDAGARARVDELGIKVDSFMYEQMPRLLHGPTAAAALAAAFPQIPRDVIQAIDRHTVGAPDMTPLDMVVYVADAIEPTRTFGSVDELREQVGKVSLEELFLVTFEHLLLMLVSRKRELHPDTVRIWNAYIARRASKKG